MAALQENVYYMQDNIVGWETMQPDKSQLPDAMRHYWIALHTSKCWRWMPDFLTSKPLLQE